MNEEQTHFSARVVFALPHSKSATSARRCTLADKTQPVGCQRECRERVCNLLPCLHAPINLVDANLSTWMLFYSLLSQKFPLDIIIQEQGAAFVMPLMQKVVSFTSLPCKAKVFSWSGCGGDTTAYYFCFYACLPSCLSHMEFFISWSRIEEWL